MQLSFVAFRNHLIVYLDQMGNFFKLLIRENQIVNASDSIYIVANH